MTPASLTDPERPCHCTTPGGLELDHVVMAVADLETAARQIERRYGLTAVEGGRHPGWGTANWIVPLGENYLELVAVVDQAEAAQSPFGRWVAAARPDPVLLLGWAVRTQQLDPLSHRLELTVSDGSRAGRDGRLLNWRVAGLEQAAVEPSLPFFIEWGEGTSPPGRVAVSHRAGHVTIAELRLLGDADRLTRWLGDHLLAITVRAGAPAVDSVLLTGAAGEIAGSAPRRSEAARGDDLCASAESL